MTMARRIESHLARMGVDYELVMHPYSVSSLQSARKAHLSANDVIKSVVTHDGDCYCLCIMPASHRLMLTWLNEHMHGDFRLVCENELSKYFDDCELGAIPALGQVYGMPVIWDQSLAHRNHFYFESGDHEHLIHINKAVFMELMGGQEHTIISCPDDRFLH